MKDYFSSDALLDEKDEVIQEYNDMERLSSYHRPRFGTLKEAYDFDSNEFLALLNRDDLQDNDAVKYRLAALYERVVYEYIDSNDTNKSWGEFQIRRIGKEKYDQLLAEWIRERGNEFFQRVGLPEAQKPSAIYMFKPEEE